MVYSRVDVSPEIGIVPLIAIFYIVSLGLIDSYQHRWELFFVGFLCQVLARIEQSKLKRWLQIGKMDFR